MKKIPDILKEKAIGFVFNLVSLLVIVVVLLLVIWAFAAFTEPSSAPSASNQDFAQNILGADNNNNSFASTNVAANADGSIIERLEEIQGKTIGTTNIGGVTGSITGSLAEMIDYLWDNRTSFGTSPGSWTQCAHFVDTAGNDIDLDWDDACASYNEIFFACALDPSFKAYSGPFYNNSPIPDSSGFSAPDDNILRNIYNSVGWVYTNPRNYKRVTSNGIITFEVRSNMSDAAEGDTCNGNNTDAITGDEYWIYGRN